MVGSKSEHKMGVIFDKDENQEDLPSSQEIKKKVRTPKPTRSVPKKKDVKKTTKNTKSSQFFDESAKDSDSDSQDDVESEQSSTTDSESEQSSQQSRQAKEIIVLDTSDDDKKERRKKRPLTEPAKAPLSTRRTKTSNQPIKLQVTPPSWTPSTASQQTVSNNQVDEESDKENVENYSTPKLTQTKKQTPNGNQGKKLSLKPNSKNEYVLVPLISEGNVNNNETSTFQKSSPSKRTHDEIENDKEESSPSPAPSTPKTKTSKLEADIGESTPVPKKSKTTTSKPPSIKTVRKEVKTSSKTPKSPSEQAATPLQSKKSGWKKQKEEQNNNNNSFTSSENNNNSMEPAVSPSIAKAKKYTKKSPSTPAQNDNDHAQNNNNNYTSTMHTDSNGNEIARMLQNLPADEVQVG